MRRDRRSGGWVGGWVGRWVGGWVGGGLITCVSNSVQGRARVWRGVLGASGAKSWSNVAKNLGIAHANVVHKDMHCKEDVSGKKRASQTQWHSNARWAMEASKERPTRKRRNDVNHRVPGESEKRFKVL